MITQSDIKNANIAKRYAKALLELAQENGIMLQIHDELQSICEIFSSSPELKQVLLHPAVDMQRKKDVINSLFSQKINDKLLSFINLLSNENRIDILPSILNFYKEMENAKEGIINVTVVSAVDFPENLKNNLVQKLQTKFNKNINAVYSTDSSIIAGLIIKTEDSIIDVSYKTKFEEMKKQLV